MTSLEEQTRLGLISLPRVGVLLNCRGSSAMRENFPFSIFSEVINEIFERMKAGPPALAALSAHRCLLARFMQS